MKNEIHREFLDNYNKIHESFVRYCSSKSYGIMQTELYTILSNHTGQSYEQIVIVIIDSELKKLKFMA